MSSLHNNCWCWCYTGLFRDFSSLIDLFFLLLILCPCFYYFWISSVALGVWPLHYQKFAKYQRIYRRNISVGNLRSKLPTDTFPSVIQSVTTDGPFSVRNLVGNYRRKFSIGIYRLNYGRKSFRIKKKAGRWRGGFGGLFFFRRIQKDNPYSDVTGSPFKLPTDSPRDLKWQIRTVTCLCVR